MSIYLFRVSEKRMNRANFIVPAPTEGDFTVRKMTLDDLRTALSWAREEGWNPGVDDAVNYYSADPDGFLIGELDGVPIGCISVVKYSENCHFIGLYIVRPEYRGKGYGLKIWREAFRLIPGKAAALDAVLEQVATYERAGFRAAHSHLRYEGTFEGKPSTDALALKTIEIESLCRYDRRYFPSERRRFLETWIAQPNGRGYAIENEGELAGYGLIRKASEGWKIAPLFADNAGVAEKLILSLSTHARGERVYLDVPEINRAAIELVESYGARAVFECKRMYTAERPDLDWTGVFGVTSLEIG